MDIAIRYGAKESLRCVCHKTIGTYCYSSLNCINGYNSIFFIDKRQCIIGTYACAFKDYELKGFLHMLSDYVTQESIYGVEIHFSLGNVSISHLTIQEEEVI